MEYVNETSDAISEAQEVDQPNPVTSANSTPNPTATFDVVTSPVIYRNYVKPSATPGGAQSLKVVKQSKDAANFAELEKDERCGVKQGAFVPTSKMFFYDDPLIGASFSQLNDDSVSEVFTEFSTSMKVSESHSL